MNTHFLFQHIFNHFYLIKILMKLYKVDIVFSKKDVSFPSDYFLMNKFGKHCL